MEYLIFHFSTFIFSVFLSPQPSPRLFLRYIVSRIFPQAIASSFAHMQTVFFAPVTSYVSCQLISITHNRCVSAIRDIKISPNRTGIYTIYQTRDSRYFWSFQREVNWLICRGFSRKCLYANLCDFFCYEWNLIWINFSDRTVNLEKNLWYII